MNQSNSNSKDSLPPGQQRIFPRPDVRQSLTYTLLASAFILVGIRNPFAPDDSETLYFSIALALCILVGFSWYFVFQKWVNWARQSEEIRKAQARGAALDRTRAMGHILVSSLSLMLTMFSFITRAITPEDEISFIDDVALGAGAIIGLLASAVLARATRDMIKQIRFRRQNEPEKIMREK